MTSALLLNMSTPLIIALCVGGGLVLACLLWGIFRKFSRMSWAGWQIPVIFALSLLLKFVPDSLSPWLKLAIAGGGILLLIAAVLGLGALVRKLLRDKGKLPLGLRIFDRILGAVTAIFDLAVLIAVLGGAVLAFFEFGMGGFAPLDFILSNGIWKAAAPYIFDLLVISVLVYAVKGGYKLGMLKCVWLGFALVLTAAAFFGAIYLTFRLGFLSSFALTIGSSLGAKINGIVAIVLGYVIVVLIVFLVLFLVAAGLSALINLIVKKINRCAPFNVIDGCILAFFSYVLTFAVICAVNFAVFKLANGTFGGGEENAFTAVMQTVSAYMTRLANLFESSPLSRIFYEFNFLRMLLGG